MTKQKWIYRITTGLLSLQMIMAASFYVIQNDMVSAVFGTLGFPTFIIYPLALAKVLGIIAILTKKSDRLKEWAYAGFFFNFLLSATAHIAIGDAEHNGALVALACLIASYLTDTTRKKISY